MFADVALDILPNLSQALGGGVSLVQVLPWCRGLMLRRAGGAGVEVQGFLHTQDQLLGLIGLEQVIQRPKGDGLPGVGEIVIGRQKQDHAAQTALADLPGCLEAGASRHFDVQNRHLGSVLQEQGDGLCAGFCLMDLAQLPEMLPQNIAEHLSLQGLILRDQNLIQSSSPLAFWGMRHWITVPRFGLL